MCKFIDSKGFLTAYAHACGYLDVADIGDDKTRITMGKDGLYFVKMSPSVTQPQVWKCFDSSTARTDARKFFLKLIKEHNATRRINKS